MDIVDVVSESGFEPRIGRSVSLDHAAELLGVSRRTIYNRIREGRLQTIRTLGGSQRVLLDSVQGTRGRAGEPPLETSETPVARRPAY
jgi:excisionase family DNA binding protein